MSISKILDILIEADENEESPDLSREERLELIKLGKKPSPVFSPQEELELREFAKKHKKISAEKMDELVSKAIFSNLIEPVMEDGETVNDLTSDEQTIIG